MAPRRGAPDSSGRQAEGLHRGRSGAPVHPGPHAGPQRDAEGSPTQTAGEPAPQGRVV